MKKKKTFKKYYWENEIHASYQHFVLFLVFNLSEAIPTICEAVKIYKLKIVFNLSITLSFGTGPSYFFQVHDNHDKRLTNVTMLLIRSNQIIFLRTNDRRTVIQVFFYHLLLIYLLTAYLITLYDVRNFSLAKIST